MSTRSPAGLPDTHLFRSEATLPLPAFKQAVHAPFWASDGPSKSFREDSNAPDTQIAAVVFLPPFSADFFVVIFEADRRQYVLLVVCRHSLLPEDQGA